LERKCRWWFGISLVVLLTLSFSWYGQRTDRIVDDLNRMFFGPELVRTGWLEVHFKKLGVRSENWADDTRLSGGAAEKSASLNGT
jgi:hypothetical protein